MSAEGWGKCHSVKKKLKLVQTVGGGGSVVLGVLWGEGRGCCVDGAEELLCKPPSWHYPARLLSLGLA